MRIAVTRSSIWAWAITLWLVVTGDGCIFGQDGWKRVFAPAPYQSLGGVCYGGGRFVAVGYRHAILTSTDGSHWAQVPEEQLAAVYFAAVGYGNGLFVAAGTNGTIMTSADGAIWTLRPSGTVTDFTSVTWASGLWLAMGAAGQCVTSRDGVVWTPGNPAPPLVGGDADGAFAVPALGYIGVRGHYSYVVPGSAGNIMISPNTVSWQSVPAGTGQLLHAAAFFRGQFLVVGDAGVVVRSADAAGPWTLANSGLDPQVALTGVAANDTMVVAVGSDGSIWQSAPAATLPMIAKGPATQQAGVNDNVLFRVVAAGASPLSYQWFFNGLPVPGQTADQLLLPKVSAAQAGAYTVAVKNGLGTVTSGLATLSVFASTSPAKLVDPSFSTASLASLPATFSWAGEQSTGKVLITYATPDRRRMIARLNSDGSLDSTFTVNASFYIEDYMYFSVVVQPDDSILVSGELINSGGGEHAGLARLKPDGTEDPSFVPVWLPAGPVEIVAREYDGGILCYSLLEPLFRVTASGLRDMNFVPQSRTYGPVVPLGNGQMLVFFSQEVDLWNRDGSLANRILVDNGSGHGFAGSASPDGGAWLERFGSGDTGTVNWQRVTPQGEVGPSWSIPDRSASASVTSVVGADGKIWRAWHARENNMATWPDTGVERFNSDGTPDLAIDTSSALQGYVTGLFPLRDGRCLVRGSGTIDGVSIATPVRLLATNATARREAPVVVSVSPASATVPQGSAATLTVIAAGAGPLTYRWNGPVDTVSPDHTTATLSTALPGTFTVTVEVTNAMGTMTSTPATVVVTPTPPAIVGQPADLTAGIGRSVTFTAGVAGTVPFTFQWYRDGQPIAGATAATLTLSAVTSADAGAYSAVVSNSLGSVTSQSARLSVNGVPQLANLSTRASAGPGDHALVVGFVVTGASKTVIVRAVGAGLVPYGIGDYLPNPVITLYDGGGHVLDTARNWSSLQLPAAAFVAVGAFPLTGTDAAMQDTLVPGAYTVTVTDANSKSGVALVEVYEADNNTTRLVNLSSRAYVDGDSNPAIAGLVVHGAGSGKYLIRGIGPGLAGFGVGGMIGDPKLTLTSASGTVVATNDNWSDGANAADIASAAAQTGAFALAAGSKDAALLVTLAPGNYTAIVSGANGATGAALVEVYEVR